MKKSIAFIVFLMFITIAVFPSGESAGATVTLETWESYNVGRTYGSGNYIDWEQYLGSDGKIFDSTPVSPVGTKTLNLGYGATASGYNKDADGVWINASSSLGYISDICFNFQTYIYYFKSGTYMNQGIFNMYVYSNSVEVLHIYFKSQAGSGNAIALGIYDSNNVIHYLVDSAGDYDLDAGWFNISHISGNSMNYTYNREGASDVLASSRSLNDWDSFDSIKIVSNTQSGSSHGVGFVLDNIIISSEKQASSDECEYRYMTERYSYVGNVNSYCERESYKKTVETRYNIITKQNVTCIDLAVGSDQYNDDADKNNYKLTFNGLGMGSPDCFIEYSYYHILRWIVDVELNNDIIILEFTHSEKTSFGRYWNIVTGCNSYTDLDNDGEVHYCETTTADGEYNGQMWAWDIAYQMYYKDIQFPDDEEYYDNDYISVLNETHYCGEPVWLTYLLTSMASDTYVRIWNNDTSLEVNDVMYPYKCPTTTETVGFVAEVKANYTARLYRNSVELDNCSFFVEDFRNPTNYVYTMPNPCFEGEPYTVKYAFDNADSYDGAIFLSGTPDYKNYYDIHYILDGESGSYVQIQDVPCTLYYILAVNKNGTYYVVDNGIHQHTVKSKSLTNYFSLGSSHLTLEDGQAKQYITGETTHIGGNCKIYDNGKLVYTITKTPFNEFYTINTAGNHKVEMRLITNETVILHTQNYTVSGEEDAPPPEEDIGQVIRDYIKQEWGELGLLVFAFGIIIGLMLVPLYVQLKASQSQTSIEVPWIAYVLFAIVGVVVDVYLGFLPIYVILLMCIGGIACAVAMYYNRS